MDAASETLNGELFRLENDRKTETAPCALPRSFSLSFSPPPPKNKITPVAASAFSAFAYGAQGGGGGGSNANAQAKENEGGDEEKDLSAKRRKTSDGDGGGNGGGSNAPGLPTSPASPGKRAGVLFNDDFDEESPVVVVAARAGAGRGGAAASKQGRALLSDDDDEVEVEVEEVVDLTGSDGDEGEEGGGVAPAKLAARPLSPAPKQGGGKEEEEAAVVRLPSNDYDDGDDDLEGEEDGDDEEEEEQEEAKDVVAQCERVAADLRKALGLAQGADRVNATGEDGGGGGSGGESGGESGGGGPSGLAAAPGSGWAPPPLTSSSSSSPPTPTSGIMTAAEIAAAAGHADSGACLRLFQVVGVNFLLLLDSHRCRGGERGSGGSGRGGEGNTTSASDKGSGCIVADEMGLGKTAQCCTFLAVRRARLRAVAEAAEAEAERARDAARKKVVGDRNDDGDGGDGGVFSSDEEELEAKNDPAARRASARAAEAREAASRPALVVVPSSLADNWLRELAVFAPRLRVLRFHASADRKQAMRDFGRGRRAVEALRGDGENGENGIDVILTTYPLFESSGADAKDARSWLKKIPLGVLALDEAHAVKAGAAVSARARRLGELSEGAAMRVFLTGTPLQNKLGELKTLLAFLLPGFDWEQLADDDDDEDESKSRSSEQAARLRKALAPFCLRRLKSEVAKQLPPKTREDVILELQGEQRRAYDSALRAFAAKINNNTKTALATRNGDVVDGDDGENGGGDENASESSEALRLLRSMPAKALASSFTHLRKLSNQPLLVRGGHFFDAAKVEELARASAALGLFGDGAGMSTPPGGESGGDALLARIREELSGYSDLDLHNLAVSGGQRTRHLLLPSDAPLRASAKSARLAELLPRLRAQGSRVLLFSQWLGCLDVLGMLLDHLGLSWSRLDGSTPVAERMALVDEFNGNSSRSGEKQQHNNSSSKTKPPPFAMLLSTRAGGQGLNLTGADTVIFHDVGFNPSVERQGEDRAHRLGQRRPVKVYRLVSEGTVDEGIVELARRKAALGDAVMGENGEGGEGGEASASSGEKEGMAQLLMQALQKVQGGGGAGG